MKISECASAVGIFFSCASLYFFFFLCHEFSPNTNCILAYPLTLWLSWARTPGFYTRHIKQNECIKNGSFVAVAHARIFFIFRPNHVSHSKCLHFRFFIGVLMHACQYVCLLHIKLKLIHGVHVWRETLQKPDIRTLSKRVCVWCRHKNRDKCEELRIVSRIRIFNSKMTSRPFAVWLFEDISRPNFQLTHPFF